MAPEGFLSHRCQGSMGCYILMPAFGARFLAGSCQAPFHWPLDGEAQRSWRLCMREESLGFIPSEYHPEKLRQGERKLLTSKPGFKRAGCEIRENIWSAPSAFPPEGLEGSVDFACVLNSVHSH